MLGGVFYDRRKSRRLEEDGDRKNRPLDMSGYVRPLVGGVTPGSRFPANLRTSLSLVGASFRIRTVQIAFWNLYSLPCVAT